MSAQRPASQPTLVWGAQLVGTIGIAFAVYLYFGNNPLFNAMLTWSAYSQS